MVTTHLFSWIQEAEFYFKLHSEAVSLQPLAQGHQQWIDVGCGPGLVTRLAAARGYEALGIDVNPEMVTVARRIADRKKSSATFRVGSHEDLPEASASVISATSLLAVLPDPVAGLLGLWRGVRPGGTLLIVEPTAEMTVEHARQLIQNGLPAKRSFGLYLWATARQGRVVDPAIYARLHVAHQDYIPLLNGLVGAWIFHKSPGGN